MKKALLWPVKFVVTVFLIGLLFLHYLGLIFAASLIIAGIVGWGFGVTTALAYLSIAWKVYAGVGIFNFAFMTTFAHQHCCVGLNTFGGHIRHRGWQGVGEDLFASIVWPWHFYQFDRFLKGWGLSLADAVLNAIQYWLVDSWRGTIFSSVNFQTGEVTTGRVKTPDEAHAAIVSAITEHLPDEK
ncbi:MAG: hypothetical protein G01um101420_805 [Parcubacteria group bacterium Gr01-1014_20]|nr:MAG: hypothetical protein G01um101420_805 [Parcubacteria group bacterium Gr01-1014_20]